jgi:hypothetical protein
MVDTGVGNMTMLRYLAVTAVLACFSAQAYAGSCPTRDQHGDPCVSATSHTSSCADGAQAVRHCCAGRIGQPDHRKSVPSLF